MAYKDQLRLTESKLLGLAHEIHEHWPQCEVVTQPADLADRASTVELAARVCRVTNSVDGFVHCAGVGEPAADLSTLKLSDFEEALEVNVTASLMLTQALLEALVGHRPAARIVMVGAGMDQQAQPGTGSYGISRISRNGSDHRLVTVPGPFCPSLLMVFQGTGIRSAHVIVVS